MRIIILALLLVVIFLGANNFVQAYSPKENSYSIKVDTIKKDLYIKDYKAVIKKTNPLIKDNPSDTKLYILRAKANNGLKEYKKAVKDASFAIGLAPFSTGAYNERAYSYYMLNSFELANKDIIRALEVNPQSFRAEKLKNLVVQKQQQLLDIQKATAKQQNAKNKPIYRDAFNFDNKPQRSDKAVFLIKAYLAIFIIALFLVLGLWLFKKFANKAKKQITDIKDKYVFVRQIGEGGMGFVYEGYDKTLNRKVAIKKVKPELLQSKYIREKFLTEARMVALLRHPCIVEIYTVIETGEGLYLVFEYVEGQTVETRLDIDGYINVEEAKWIFKSVCKALHYAHSQDIIHCDLKPSNIMITDDKEVKVMDFGVAKKLDGKVSARTVAGTPVYMAPEQNKGFIKKQSDIYSLGVCLYEALTGQVPWNVEGFDLHKRTAVPPSQLVPSIPPKIDEIISKCLKEDPSERIQSVKEFWDMLENI
ncbi:MAG: protein kinase [Elusimicrobiaceae bacterium]|nr:protein kinase [Elusimicrobiaceae bacterium]MBT3954688.1 protein kinase [Elusimicrobiaceae bacterium]MBT4008050.1 protein kinase [Elusimicrobiaceae bacterium]MBT4402609.1 protein kinase [Elusimicrobiaceae bacterium]MBT4439364.1 protein kinase [Elusimicrobiaceae bacterium]